MFDLRYHVASLAAVFLALVIGILVGLGLSGRGFIDNVERDNLNDRIDLLSAELEATRNQLQAAGGRRAAMADYADDTYPVLADRRLEDVNVAILFIGSLDDPLDAITEAVGRGGGRVVRTRALRVPVEPRRLREALGKTPELQRRYASLEDLDDLGRALGAEFAAGGATPLWDALSDVLVEERDVDLRIPADAVVVARTARPQHGATQDFLAGLYRGVARTGLAAVGVEQGAREASAIPVFVRSGLATVDSVETAAGRLALVLVLAGQERGNYGVDVTATDGVLPRIQSLPER